MNRIDEIIREEKKRVAIIERKIFEKRGYLFGLLTAKRIMSWKRSPKWKYMYE